MTENTSRLSTALADRYRIERRLGEGGMATVYLAEDIKHKRKVAVKVLRPELAAVLGGERFVQEITTTANLQHPHILPLFDSGEADGFLYYVMPFIDGETLRDKLDRETQLGVDESVRIARDVADALDYAHRQGIIHRDIKPENILLHDGRPVVADFGIALAVSAAAGGRMTETGLSLGTPHYMSPEQATAEKELTNRSDVYSLGSVLYEMLTGDPPHTASSAQAIIMKIVTEDAPLVTKARKTVPPHVAAAVAQSLEKLPADRFESAKAFAEALDNTAFAYSSTGIAPATRPAPTSGGATGKVHAIVTAVLAASLAWVVLTPGSETPAVPFHTSLSDTVLPLPQGIAISPDGRTIALSVPVADGRTQLFLRAAEDETFRPVAGVFDVFQLGFSPDGNSIAFIQTVPGGFGYAQMPIAGGPVQTIADSVDYGAWGKDGTIVVVRGRRVFRKADGATGFQLVFESDSLTITSPGVLPDGSGMLFSDDELGSGRGLILDFETGTVRELLPQALNPRYVESGHVVFNARPPAVSMMAVPFDLSSRRVTGPEVPVLQEVWRTGGTSFWDISANGTMVYVRAPSVGDGERLGWVDMAGSLVQLPLQIPDIEVPRISPDGRRVAFIDFNNRSMAVYDVSTGATARFGDYVSFEWGPDSRTLYAGSTRGSRNAIIRLSIDGGAPDTILPSDGQVFAVTPDESALVIGRVTQSRGHDIDIVRLNGGSPEIVPYLRANWHERQGALSPDGRWLAYVSNESGRNEIYVRSFPDPGAPAVQLSDSGGVGPVWAPDGSAVYYAGLQSMTQVDVATTTGGLQVRSPTPLFDHSGLEITAASFFQALGFPRRYDIHPDGDRLLMVRSLEEFFDIGVPIRVIVNWFDELRQVVGEGSQ